MISNIHGELANRFNKWIYIFIIIFSSCNTTEVVPHTEHLGYQYFPLKIGQYYIYQVEQTSYTSINSPQRATFQIKEIVAGTYTNLAGEELFTIQRYYRNDSLSPWSATPDSIWSAKVDVNIAERIENNVTYIKLSFPINNNVAWDGNRFNNFKSEEYKSINVNNSYQLGSQAYNNTLTVSQSNDINLCSKDVRFEVYAYGIGLIYKESNVVEYVQKLEMCETGTINIGLIYKQQLIEYND